jgi:multiple sugar transport system ATP-binding protein
MRKTPRAEIDERVRRAAEMLDIGNLLERTPRELSGGQRQRVALGRALVREPAVFLMDEPLSNLDAQLRVQTRSEIKRLQQQVATTTVYVTHDQVEAMTMGDRVAVMHDGVLEQVADTRTIYERPANTFVAGFIGSPAMSFATLGTSRDAGGLTLRGEDLALTVPTPGAVDVPPEVVVGIRPEHTHLWRDDGMLGPLHGRASFVEMLGRETLIGVETGAGRFTVLANADTQVAAGDNVSFGVDRERVYLFDPATTAAIGVI